VYHLYVIRIADRAGMVSHLHEAGIGTGIHYPIPLHLQKVYTSLNYKRGDFPIAESIAGEIISLPMFPQLTAQEQNRVAKEIRKHISETASKDETVGTQSLVAAERTL
jgi:dTDP-4-amino-4,6-dideoxygalactose transaminase